VDKLTTVNPFNRAPAASSALLTYEPFYGLREKPFSLATDPKFFYKSAAHAGTFEDLFLAIRRREGLIVLTGDIGTGKTTLCKGVLERLDRKTFTTFVPDPFVTREDLLKMMLLDFGVMSVDDLKSGRMAGASRPDLSYPLYDFLKSLVPLQAFAVLIIDEAQNLSPALLEEIRILSDLEAPEKLLQVVLIGQLELRAKLKLPEMRQLDQRVCAMQLEAAQPGRGCGIHHASPRRGRRRRRPRALFTECRRRRVPGLGRHSPRHQSHLRSSAAPQPPHAQERS
jgi:general secretion pathway protein A